MEFTQIAEPPPTCNAKHYPTRVLRTLEARPRSLTTRFT